MKRRGFLGALLGGAVAAVMAPLAVAAPVSKKIQQNTAFGRFGADFDGDVVGHMGRYPVGGFEREYKNIWVAGDTEPKSFASSTEETDIASKINAMAPGHGQTRFTTYVDEMAWIDDKGVVHV